MKWLARLFDGLVKLAFLLNFGTFPQTRLDLQGGSYQGKKQRRNLG